MQAHTRIDDLDLGLDDERHVLIASHATHAYVYLLAHDRARWTYRQAQSHSSSSSSSSSSPLQQQQQTHRAVSPEAFDKILAEEFPHLLPWSKRVCPVCESLCSDPNDTADQETEKSAKRWHHRQTVETERVFAVTLRTEARQAIDRVRVVACWRTCR